MIFIFSFPIDLKFAALVTVVQRYVSTKSEVSTAFIFLEIGGTGRTERPGRGAALNVARR